MMRSAVSLPPSSEVKELPTIVSGIMAVSAEEARAIARSKPATFWNRLTTRSTNSGRSQNVSVRRTRPRSSQGCGSVMAVRRPERPQVAGGSAPGPGIVAVGAGAVGLELARPPALVEERLERAVQAQDREPALARDGLHPVVLLARRRLGAEIQVRRAVRVLPHGA